MAKTRRKAGDAITPDKTPKPITSAEKAFIESGAISNQSDTSDITDSKISNKSSIAKKSVIVRMNPDLADKLWQACAARRMDRLEPYSQNGVIVEAIEDWLKKNS